MFTKEDVEKVMDTLDEFQTRHSTIEDSIEASYMIGNQLRSFIER